MDSLDWLMVSLFSFSARIRAMDKALPVTGHTYSQINFTVALGFAAVLLFFITAGGAAYSNTRIIQQNTQGIIHTHQVILALDDLLSLMKDAETGQRGYLITGDEKYLEPYNAALAHIESRLEDIERLTRANGEQTTRLPKMKEHIHTKLAELKETIDMRRVKGFDAARVIVVTDRGKNEMDALRAEIAQEQEEENVIRAQLLSETENSYHIALLTDLLTCLLGLVLSAVVAFLVRRTTLARQKEDWLQSGQVGLGKAMLGDQREERLGENVLTHLAHYLDASVGAFYVAEGGEYRRAASYGVPIDAAIVNRFSVGDGLLGQAVRDKRAFFVHNLPDGYLTMSSALGRGKPRHVVIRPVEADGIVNGVIELGFSRQPGNLAIEMLERVSQTIAVCVRSASYRSHLQNLLEETQRQAEELQTQSEELRVNNEELEEQGRALKETQAHMEQQQAELEQTNSQLEEQAQQLELQRDDLSRSKEIVQQKARELQQASQYKSDFLANMSHELRTPLNSSLILAKLLADNVAKNLTPEQVKFAQTIQSSGNDLLLLINDILDLSKIEAGHMDVRPENVALERIANQMRRLFEPLAAQKGLVLAVTLATDCPSSIETDPQRLEQILKNLLSNAIKFTEKGEVKLSIAVVGKKIAFTVSDTGIGIAPEHQQTVFEAFRQADGTINRKYGGTGLGLSISRELARLLGGEIRLDSQQGQGSSFTLSLAETYDAQATGYLTVKSTEETLPSTLLQPRLNAKGARARQNLRLVMALMTTATILNRVHA
jgi:signal transduction histidine kinase/CHASE3 domain sensor protein